jgi:Domain of unknown function (DUF4430)
MSASSRSARRALRNALVLTLPAAGLLAGCGLGAGAAPTGVGLTVSSEFGARLLSQSSAPRVRGSETVMSLLMRNNPVTTRFGGGFVQSIHGLSGGQQAGEPVDWFYYVNGVEAPKGAAGTVVHTGDRIWWDLHNWSQTEDVPAVVGSFPEPFVRGIEGRRLPVRVECAEAQGKACHTVSTRLSAFGVPAAISTVAPGEEPDTLRVLVGSWPKLAEDPSARSIERGPATSGVYARPAANGATLTLLNADGHTTRTLGPGAGLIAATRYGQGAPVWVISGTNAAGVALAAKDFDQVTLSNRFAVALTAAGQVLALPQPSP